MRARPQAAAVAGFAVAAAFFCFAFVVRVAPSVITDELMRDFAAGAAALGQLSAAYFYAYAAMQVPAGVLVDRLGSRGLLTGSIAVAAAGTVGFALSDGLAGAWAGRLLVGFGCAFSWVGCLAVAAQWFPRERFARLAGIGQLAGVGGAVLGQAPFALLAAATGWRAAFGAIAAAAGVLAALAWLLVRDRPPERGPPHAASGGVLAGLRIVARNRQTWLAAAYGFTLSAPIQAFSGLWAVPYLVAAHGVARDVAALTCTLTFVGYALGAPVVGWLADRLGRRPPMIAGSLAAAACMGLLTWWPSAPLPLVQGLMMLLGVTSAAMFLGFICGREHNPPQAVGTAVGVVNTAVMASGALFQQLIGAILDLRWTGLEAGGARLYTPAAYGTALALLPVACLAAAALAWWLREPPRP